MLAKLRTAFRRDAAASNRGGGEQLGSARPRLTAVITHGGLPIGAARLERVTHHCSKALGSMDLHLCTALVGLHCCTLPLLPFGGENSGKKDKEKNSRFGSGSGINAEGEERTSRGGRAAPYAVLRCL